MMLQQADRDVELEQALREGCKRSCCNETALLMLEQLHRAVHGDSWAQDASPERVWGTLLEKVKERQ